MLKKLRAEVTQLNLNNKASMPPTTTPPKAPTLPSSTIEVQRKQAERAFDIARMISGKQQQLNIKRSHG